MEEELVRLVAEGTLEPMQMAEWASPIVPVVKSDKKSVRIYGDFKQKLNPVAKLDKYPILEVEDLFVKLTGGSTFTKIGRIYKFCLVVTHRQYFEQVIYHYTIT